MISHHLRDLGIKILKKDIISFLEEHEDEIVKIVRQELEIADREIPEEEAYIDIHMGKLGEKLTRAIMKAVRRFFEEY